MRNAFNVVMRVVSTLIGFLMACMGGIWVLQGLNLAFRVGFMVGDKRWVVYGAILAVVGVAQVVWSNTRQAPARPGAAVSPR
jgi:drug/metabolite transporter superfamily protein YnfA|nr:hypothetical protein [Phenylobacterium sp.]